MLANLTPGVVVNIHFHGDVCTYSKFLKDSVSYRLQLQNDHSISEVSKSYLVLDRRNFLVTIINQKSGSYKKCQ